MRQAIHFLVLAAFLMLSAMPALAADPMKDKEASPTLGERITKDSVKGTLMKIDGEFYTVKDNDGKLVRLHVDKSTKLDKVVEGDKVKAYYTDQGHTTTMQRVDDK
jgi:hypothetical protein